MSNSESKPRITTQVSQSPYCFVSRDAYLVAVLEMNNNEEGTLIVHENFYRYQDQLLANEHEKQRVNDELLEYHIEKHYMQTQSLSSYNLREADFETYSKRKYSKLFDYIEKMVDAFFFEKEKLVIDRHNPFDSIAFMTVKQDNDSDNPQMSITVNSVFLDYLSEENVPTDERNEILRDLVLQLKEKYEVQSNKNCVLHNDTAMFEYHCRLKYFKLYTNITRMIDKLEKSLKEKRHDEF